MRSAAGARDGDKKRIVGNAVAPLTSSSTAAARDVAEPVQKPRRQKVYVKVHMHFVCVCVYIRCTVHMHLQHNRVTTVYIPNSTQPRTLDDDCCILATDNLGIILDTALIVDTPTKTCCQEISLAARDFTALHCILPAIVMKILHDFLMVVKFG